VAYAHRNLVVHRDLKPSNILVSPDGTPRLLDFGIAKLLTDDEESIDQTQGLGPCTPRYSSPEQIRGGSITTASDIFVLGIILYELVTGAHPFDAARHGETSPMIDVLRRICEAEPIKPRDHPEKAQRNDRIRQSLGGDLQSIILKALQKAPADRYKSVEYLIDDVQNFVNRRPVLARRQSWWYRTRTLLRRHPTAALATSAAVVVALVAVGFILASDRTARKERDYALQQRELAASSARTMMNDLASSLESMSAPIERRLELLNQVAAVFDQIDATSRTDVDPVLSSVQLRAEVQTELILARALEELGDMQGAIHRAEAGELSAKKMLNRQIADPIDQLFLEEALLEKCRVFFRSGNVVAADELLEKVLVKLREVENVHALAATPRRRLEILLCNALVLEERLSDPFAKPNETAELLKEAIQYGESAFQKESFDREALDCYAGSLEELAGFYYAWGHFDLFTGLIRKALALRRTAAEEVPADMFLQQRSERAIAHWESQLALADPQEQETTALNESLSIQRKLCAADPNNLDLLEDLIGVFDNDAIILSGRKEYGEAKKLLQEALEIGRKLKQEKRRTFNVVYHLYRIAFTLSLCSRMTGDLEAARKINLELLAPLSEELNAVDSNKCDSRFREVFCCSAQAEVAGAAGNWREAQQMYLKSLSDLEENFHTRDYPYDQYAYGYCLARLGLAEAELGKTGTGCRRIEHGLGILYGLRDSGRVIPRSFISDDIAEAEEALHQFQKGEKNTDPSVDLGTK
jgi:tetratricopeptide (TPR) repeat protein